MLSKKAVNDIKKQVDEVFDRLKWRLIGPQSVDKRLYIGFDGHLSLPGLFSSASMEHGSPPSEKTLNTILNVASDYIDAYRMTAQAKIIHEIQSFLSEAAAKGVETNVETVLGGRLSEIWRDVSNSIHTIISSESQNAKNFSLLDGIVKINAYNGVEDPVVFFVTYRDNMVCEECLHLHLLDDGVTPRLWKLSECKHGYHKKGEEFPALGGEHPHCRCSLTSIDKGWGFGPDGMVRYITPGHDEFERQRGVEKSIPYTPHECELKK